MAIFKKISAAGKYQDDNAINDVVSYILQRSKTTHGIIGGIHIDENDIPGSMIRLSESFKKNSLIRLHHFIVSFCPSEVYATGSLICIAGEICDYLGQAHQVVYALHEDTYFPHLHFVFNAVSLNGQRYRGGIQERKELVRIIGKILRAYGVAQLKVVEYHLMSLQGYCHRIAARSKVVHGQCSRLFIMQFCQFL